MTTRMPVPNPLAVVREAVQVFQGEFGSADVIKIVEERFPSNYLFGPACTQVLGKLIKEGLVEYVEPPRAGMKSKYRLKVARPQ